MRHRSYDVDCSALSIYGHGARELRTPSAQPEITCSRTVQLLNERGQCWDRLGYTDGARRPHTNVGFRNLTAQYGREQKGTGRHQALAWSAVDVGHRSCAECKRRLRFSLTSI